jgi:hypothetical protein
MSSTEQKFSPCANQGSFGDMAQDVAAQAGELEPGEDDPGKSVRCNFDLRLRDDYAFLIHGLTSGYFRFQGIERARISTFNQVERTLDCLVANLIHANQISPACHISISMRRGTYTKNRYAQHGIGYDNLSNIIEYLKDVEPSLITYYRGFYDRRGPRNQGRETRIKATQELLELVRGYNKAGEEGLLNQEETTWEDVLTTIKGYNDLEPITGRISIAS